MQDSVELLKECDSGSKTAVNSIKEVLDNVQSEKLLKILSTALTEHEKLGDEVHDLLNKLGASGKDPAPMARAMSWMKINMKMMTSPDDKTVAHLMVDGCDMGIKQLNEYLNQYENADEEAKRLAKKLIRLEEALRDDCMAYV